MVAYLGNDDPTTRRMLEGILAMEEEHADDLVSLLEELGPGSAPAAAAPGSSGAAPVRPVAKKEGAAAKPSGAPAPKPGAARSRAAAGRGSVRGARRRTGVGR